MLGPTQRIYRASCYGVEVRLRVNVDNAWVVIRRPGREPFYRDVDQCKVAGVLAEFEGIAGSPERFNAFVQNSLGR